MNKRTNHSRARQSADRLVSAFFGVLFVAIAVAIVVVTLDSGNIAAHLLALLIGFLGVEALLSAARNRPSLLSRIGPLP